MAAVPWPKSGGQAPGQVGGNRLTPPAGDLPQVSMEPRPPQSISSAMLWSMHLQLACARQVSGHKGQGTCSRTESHEATHCSVQLAFFIARLS